MFDTEVAVEYGVDCAIMIKNLQYWIEKNKANDKNFYDGRYWTYNSSKALAKLFPFWNQRHIELVLKKLVDQGVLIRGNYNSSAYDRTLWYAFTDESRWIYNKDETHLQKTGNGNLENCESYISTKELTKELPNILPDNSTPNKTTSSFITPNTNSDDEIIMFGEFKNVKLTKKEFIKLVNTYKSYFPDAIEALSAYIATYGGKQYKGKTHYAIFNRNNWVWEKVHKNPDAGLEFRNEIITDKNGVTRPKTHLEFFAEMYNINID